MNTSGFYQGLYFFLQRLRKEPVEAALRELRVTQTWDAERLRMLQAQRMQAILRHAVEEVPFYRDHFHWYIKDIRRITDWKEMASLVVTLPELTKPMALEAGGRLLAGNANRFRSTMNTTSGSSGAPFAYPCDNLAWAYRHAALFVCLESYGLKTGDAYGYFFGQHWIKAKRWKTNLKDRIFNRVRVSAFEQDPEFFLKKYQALVRNKAKYLMGYPSAIYNFIHFGVEAGLDFRKIPLKAVFVTSEVLYPYQKELIESALAIPCVNMYGSVEGGVGALERPAKGMALSMETTFLWINTKNEIISTDMFLRKMPLINFNTGDLGTIRETDGERPVLTEVVGRSGQTLSLPDGRTANPLVPYYIFKSVKLDNSVRNYRFYHLTEEKRLVLLVESAENFTPEMAAILSQVSQKAFGLPVKLIQVKRLPLLPNAKHRDYVEQKRLEL